MKINSENAKPYRKGMTFGVSFFFALILMALNLVVLELGRRGLWHNNGAGFSPWYPVRFAVMHLLFWPVKIFLDRSSAWWIILAELVLMGCFLFYNYTSLMTIMYVS